jgi:hypothetical protein
MDLTGLGSIADLIKSGIDKIWPDKTQKEKDEMAQSMLLLQGQLALQQGQMDVNKVEAASSSTFVAGWRPFIGWVCGLALCFQYLVRPIVMAIAQATHHPMLDFPGLDNNLWELLTGMLGLGGLRTFEKIKGVATK